MQARKLYRHIFEQLTLTTEELNEIFGREPVTEMPMPFNKGYENAKLASVCAAYGIDQKTFETCLELAAKKKIEDDLPECIILSGTVPLYYLVKLGLKDLYALIFGHLLLGKLSNDAVFNQKILDCLTNPKATIFLTLEPKEKSAKILDSKNNINYEAFNIMGVIRAFENDAKEVVFAERVENKEIPLKPLFDRFQLLYTGNLKNELNKKLAVLGLPSSDDASLFPQQPLMFADYVRYLSWFQDEIFSTYLNQLKRNNDLRTLITNATRYKKNLSLVGILSTIDDNPDLCQVIVDSLLGNNVPFTLDEATSSITHLPENYIPNYLHRLRNQFERLFSVDDAGVNAVAAFLKMLAEKSNQIIFIDLLVSQNKGKFLAFLSKKEWFDKIIAVIHPAYRSEFINNTIGISKFVDYYPNSYAFIAGHPHFLPAKGQVDFLRKSFGAPRLISLTPTKTILYRSLSQIKDDERLAYLKLLGSVHISQLFNDPDPSYVEENLRAIPIENRLAVMKELINKKVLAERFKDINIRVIFLNVLLMKHQKELKEYLLPETELKAREEVEKVKRILYTSEFPASWFGFLGGVEITLPDGSKKTVPLSASKFHELIVKMDDEAITYVDGLSQLKTKLKDAADYEISLQKPTGLITYFTRATNTQNVYQEMLNAIVPPPLVPEINSVREREKTLTL